LARTTTRRSQELEFSRRHRDAWYAATVSYTKGVTVAIVGIASTLVISRVRRSACLYADSEIRGSRYQSTVPDSPDR